MAVDAATQKLVDEARWLRSRILGADEGADAIRVADALGNLAAALEAAQRPRVEYPHESGDAIVLGPGTFVARDGSVLNWKGKNYAPQRPPVSPEVREEIAREIDPNAWEGHEPGRGFDDPEMQAEYLRHFAEAVVERRSPSLEAADRLLARFSVPSSPACAWCDNPATGTAQSPSDEQRYPSCGCAGVAGTFQSSQPVYDEYAVGRFIQENFNAHRGKDGVNPYSLAAALVAALSGLVKGE